MAANFTSVPKTLECTICFSLFDDPRNLSCGHTFCLSCLERMENAGHVKCPICRVVDDVRPNGVRGLKPNYTIRDLINDGNIQTKDPSGDGSFCKEHNEKSSLCCDRCMVLICAQCLLSTHRGHHYRDPEDVIREYKLKISGLLRSSVALKERFEVVNACTISAREKWERKRQIIAGQIDIRRDILVGNITTEAFELLNKLRLETNPGLDSLEGKELTVKSSIHSKFDRLNLYLNQVQRKDFSCWTKLKSEETDLVRLDKEVKVLEESERDTSFHLRFSASLDDPTVGFIEEHEPSVQQLEGFIDLPGGVEEDWYGEGKRTTVRHMGIKGTPHSATHVGVVKHAGSSYMVIDDRFKTCKCMVESKQDSMEIRPQNMTVPVCYTYFQSERSKTCHIMVAVGLEVWSFQVKNNRVEYPVKYCFDEFAMTSYICGFLEGDNNLITFLRHPTSMFTWRPNGLVNVSQTLPHGLHKIINQSTTSLLPAHKVKDELALIDVKSSSVKITKWPIQIPCEFVLLKPPDTLGGKSIEQTIPTVVSSGTVLLSHYWLVVWVEHQSSKAKKNCYVVKYSKDFIVKGFCKNEIDAGESPVFTSDSEMYLTNGECIKNQIVTRFQESRESEK